MATLARVVNCLSSSLRGAFLPVRGGHREQGGIRTLTLVGQQGLSLSCLPFHHSLLEPTSQAGAKLVGRVTSNH